MHVLFVPVDQYGRFNSLFGHPCFHPWQLDSIFSFTICSPLKSVWVSWQRLNCHCFYRHVIITSSLPKVIFRKPMQVDLEIHGCKGTLNWSHVCCPLNRQPSCLMHKPHPCTCTFDWYSRKCFSESIGHLLNVWNLVFQSIINVGDVVVFVVLTLITNIFLVPGLQWSATLARTWPLLLSLYKKGWEDRLRRTD